MSGVGWADTKCEYDDKITRMKRKDMCAAEKTNMTVAAATSPSVVSCYGDV